MTHATTWATRRLLDGSYAGVARGVRALLHWAVWAPLLRVCAGRLRVVGAPAEHPVVYAANHASHADTVAVRMALRRHRRRLAVAAAEDYFFATAGRGTAFTVAVGAFPFPRSGDTGLRRAASLLDAGWSVLLYPEGTRGGGRFHPGVLRLAEQGWEVVPVGIAGTRQILPKGARWPRRNRVGVVFGRPLAPHELARGDALERLRLAIAEAAVEAERLTR